MEPTPADENHINEIKEDFLKMTAQTPRSTLPSSPLQSDDPSDVTCIYCGNTDVKFRAPCKVEKCFMKRPWHLQMQPICDICGVKHTKMCSNGVCFECDMKFFGICGCKTVLLCGTHFHEHRRTSYLHVRKFNRV